MIFVYNFLQLALLLFTLPLLVLIVASRQKYRARIGRRLGIGLSKLLGPHHEKDRKVIWMHALSVGEVTSALPLVRGIQEELNDVRIIFSVSTMSGGRIAEQLMTPYVDRVIAAPLDLLFTVNRFIDAILPDLFILIETDFWPNWLHRLKKRKVPMMLANGRVSKKSFATYRRYRFFFSPLFNTFSLLSVQTEQDASQMRQIGVSRNRVVTLGNLKYDIASPYDNFNPPLLHSDLGLPENAEVWICGSTHRGEEEILLPAYSQVKKEHPNLALIIAPRDIGRGDEIEKLAKNTGLQVSRRTSPGSIPPEILILDTIGELSRCYEMAKIAYIGGSLVPCGGHNPLEAAAKGVPVLFGPHMDDFQEIARDCILHGAGREVRNIAELIRTVDTLLTVQSVYADMSQAARKMVRDNAGVVGRHLEVVRMLLADGESGRIER